ncbi:FAD-dependent oxidoreductase [Dactylosporangium sp. NPDC050688]|uniref:FAD-dependent oxidoreductase n=1 Tax=Dactylosporangium sp. NPDC050688 TaxID=3157217 RepID=UPI0033CDCC93
MSTDVDVAVAGAGGAGMAAALAAAKAGASVVVLEAFEHFAQGNNTAMSTSMIPAAGTHWQRSEGVDDSAAVFLADIAAKTKDRADPTIAKALVEVGPRLVGWLDRDCGITLELVTDFLYPGHTRPRCHTVANRAGRDLLAGLLRAARDEPGLDLIVPARLTALDEVGGGWRLTSTRPDGSSETLTTRSVVLATGGFGADRDLVGAHLPEIAGGVYAGGEGCRGDALRLAAPLELDTGYLDAYQGHGSWAVPHATLMTWASVMHGAVLVNIAGHRFGDETVGYSEYAKTVLDQPGGVAWVVLDTPIDAACQAFQDYRDLTGAGAVRWASTVDELAAVIGCPAGPLGEALLSRRDTWVAPYAAVKVTGALFHTQGGLLVDRHARVLRRGEPVPGLYAAGGAAAGISGTGAGGYLAGNGLLAALGLGYLAGTHAAGPRRHAAGTDEAER